MTTRILRDILKEKGKTMREEEEMLTERVGRDTQEKEEKRLAEQREAIMEMSGCPSECDEAQNKEE